MAEQILAKLPQFSDCRHEHMPSRCDDCAFRDGSPERARFGVWEEMVAAFKSGVPFFCHKGMRIGPDGDYEAPNDENGAPIGARICAGWLECHRGEKPWPNPIHVLRSEVLDEIEPEGAHG